MLCQHGHRTHHPHQPTYVRAAPGVSTCPTAQDPASTFTCSSMTVAAASFSISLEATSLPLRVWHMAAPAHGGASSTSASAPASVAAAFAVNRDRLLAPPHALGSLWRKGIGAGVKGMLSYNFFGPFRPIFLLSFAWKIIFLQQRYCHWRRRTEVLCHTEQACRRKDLATGAKGHVRRGTYMTDLY
jgi:hypothetical protein